MKKFVDLVKKENTRNNGRQAKNKTCLALDILLKIINDANQRKYTEQKCINVNHVIQRRYFQGSKPPTV